MNIVFSPSRGSVLHTAAAAAVTAAALLLHTSGWTAEPAAVVLPAPDTVLLQGDSIRITVSDLLADAQRIPPEVRGTVLSQPRTVAQIATNLYVRRAMAMEAQAQGLGNTPVTTAALQLARDKVLSDAWLAKIDKDSAPSTATAEGLARNIYNAKPERFKMPEQVQARHILIAGTTPEALAKAEKTLDDLKAGANFAALAQERSADPGSAAKGGDLGWFERGRMVPEFDEAAFALQQPGDLSGVVKSQFGYHIIQLDGRKPAGTKTFAEVREELVQEVQSSVQQDARVAEAQKFQQGVKTNPQAVEAFAASYSKDSKTAP